MKEGIQQGMNPFAVLSARGVDQEGLSYQGCSTSGKPNTSSGQSFCTGMAGNAQRGAHSNDEVVTRRGYSIPKPNQELCCLNRLLVITDVEASQDCHHRTLSHFTERRQVGLRQPAAGRDQYRKERPKATLGGLGCRHRQSNPKIRS